MKDDDDLFPEASFVPRPDWKRQGQTWAISLSNGDQAVATCGTKWRVVITMKSGTVEKKSPLYGDLHRCLAWAERLLFPPLTAWDRIRSV